ncbi:N-acetylglucosamine kinase [Streptomyces sp. HMX112]|uniref:N-acetylglucosamine kinase n=1 Tax=Streptomyces sp. HMX112 TaxID=3390850 RepID=UPI003A805CE2
MTSRQWVLGVDSGGSGLRVALGCARPAGRAGSARVPGGGSGGAAAPVDVRPAGTVVFDEPVRTGAGGIDAGHLLERLLPAAGELLARAGADRADAVVVGAAGMATLGDELRARVPGALRGALGARRLALAADAVTAYAGALGQRPGVVVAAGTGLIALGTDLASGWRRADGWGHLLGDCGGGAWIGRAGLEAALRAHDGRRGGSAALLARVEAVFGPPAGLPGLLYPRADRPAVLASFAPEVARCAPHDPVAAGVLADAARHIAQAAAAVCPPGPGREVALAGGLFAMGDPLLVPLRAELAEQLPYAREVSAAGDPLSGAVAVAAALATATLRLPCEPGMLETFPAGHPPTG